MANERLEKLKKMNADNLLDPKDLDQIAAGTISETADDSRFLNILLQNLPAQPDRYGEYTIKQDYHKKEVLNAWKGVGIKATFHMDDSTPNTYELDGRQITRAQAFAHAEKIVGIHLETKDWKW